MPAKSAFRIDDDFYLWEAFQAINNARTIDQFRIVDNFYLYQVILAAAAASTAGMHFRGLIDASTNPNYPAAIIGDTYEISVKGKIGGAAGIPVEPGDLIIANAANAGGTQGAVGASWDITQFGLQQIFEITGSDLSFAVLRDLTETVGRNFSMAVVTNYTETVGGNYSMAATGTWAVSGTNFAVGATGKVTAGLANGSMTIGLGSGFVVGNIQNTYVGVNIGAATTTGSRNTALGYNSLSFITSGVENTAIGVSVLSSLTTQVDNTGVGFQALLNTISNQNTGVGAYAGKLNTTGSQNTFVGDGSGNANTSGSDLALLGKNSLISNTTGSRTIAVGRDSGFTSNGNNNIFLGWSGGYYETGSNKLFIDNATRASEADGRLKSLVYGIFDALTANQFLTVNGHVLIREDLQFTTKAINVTSGNAATINSPAGRFRKDNSGAVFTLTNSYITANSIVVLTPANAAVDVTGTIYTVLAGAGSAVITWVAAPAADFDMNFLVIN